MEPLVPIVKVMGVETYRAVQGGRYKFRYVWDPRARGKIRVYVEEQPSYGARSTGAHTIHRYSAQAPELHPHICIKESAKPTTHARAQQIARKWADLTDTYIATGVSISSQINRGNVGANGFVLPSWIAWVIGGVILLALLSQCGS